MVNLEWVNLSWLCNLQDWRLVVGYPWSTALADRLFATEAGRDIRTKLGFWDALWLWFAEARHRIEYSISQCFCYWFEYLIWLRHKYENFQRIHNFALVYSVQYSHGFVYRTEGMTIFNEVLCVFWVTAIICKVSKVFTVPCTKISTCLSHILFVAIRTS
jgi:hypothetical protein